MAKLQLLLSNINPAQLHHIEVDRPAVGKVADCVGDALTGRYVLAVLPVDHALAAAGIDLHHTDVVGAEQRPAGSLNPAPHVVGLSLAHSEFAILRSAWRSAQFKPLGLRLRTVSGSIF